MVGKELEFRGINVNHLCMYFEELGAICKNDKLPIFYQAENWSGEILDEQELAFTASFKVNAVFIRFSAASEEELEALIKKYRYKTIRIGG